MQRPKQKKKKKKRRVVSPVYKIIVSQASFFCVCRFLAQSDTPKKKNTDDQKI